VQHLLQSSKAESEQHMKTHVLRRSAVVLLLTVAAAGSAAAGQRGSEDALNTATGEQIRWQVLSGGGGKGTSTNYVLSGTAGQTSVGPATSTNFTINSGYWQNFATASSCCVGLTGNVDCDPIGEIDIADLTRLIDYQYITHDPLCCEKAANTDGDPASDIDIGDITRLIDYLYITFQPLSSCQ
jgi:hypothetical protein